MNSPSLPCPARSRAAIWLILTVLPVMSGPTASGGEPGKATSLGSLRGPDGRQIELGPPSGGLTVLVFYSSECPISNAYSPTLGSLVVRFLEATREMGGDLRRP